MKTAVAVMKIYTYGKKLDPYKLYSVKFSNIMEGLGRF
jgi:hypothetical protein